MTSAIKSYEVGCDSDVAANIENASDTNSYDPRSNYKQQWRIKGKDDEDDGPAITKIFILTKLNYLLLLCFVTNRPLNKPIWIRN